MSKLDQAARIIRWQDWGPGKLTVLWSLCLYIAVAYRVPFGQFTRTFFSFLFFAAAQSALGYVLNDWGDRDLDRRQFKPNAFRGKMGAEGLLVVFLIALAALLSGVPLAGRPGFAWLWLAWVASAAAYSLEPVRLKTRGAAGIVMSFSAQWFLPVLLTFAAFSATNGPDMWVAALALTVSGFTLEVAHQRHDRARDLAAQARTFAASLPEGMVDRIYAIVLLLDKLAVGMVVLLIVFALYSLDTWWSWALAALLAGLYLGLFLVTFGNARRALDGGPIDDPYYARDKTAAVLLHQTLLNFAAPVTLGLAAVLLSPLYAVILGLFLLWRVILGGADWRWPFRVLKTRW